LNGQQITAAEALAELEEILQLAAASGTSLPRGTALRYVAVRDLLLKNGYQGQLPAYVRQCLTVDKFREFIHLYHFDHQERLAFIANSFRGPFRRPAARQIRDIFSDTEF
jgi:hypothetical protein